MPRPAGFPRIPSSIRDPYPLFLSDNRRHNRLWIKRRKDSEVGSLTAVPSRPTLSCISLPFFASPHTTTSFNLPPSTHPQATAPAMNTSHPQDDHVLPGPGGTSSGGEQHHQSPAMSSDNNLQQGHGRGDVQLGGKSEQRRGWKGKLQKTAVKKHCQSKRRGWNKGGDGRTS